MPRDAQPLQRCFWSDGSPLYDGYHDREWGWPVVDDIRLFEKISLEGFQAGLSWITILKKRDAFRAGFDGFDVRKVARYTEADVQRLLGDAGIVRHRGKIEAVIHNAGRAIDLQDEFGSLARYFCSSKWTCPSVRRNSPSTSCAPSPPRRKPSRCRRT